MQGKFTWNVSDCLVDVEAGIVSRDGAHITLDPRCWRLLTRLLERPNMIVPYEQLWTHVWPRQSIDPKQLTNVASRLRKALGSSTAIRTVPRRGLMIFAEPAAEPIPKPGAAVSASFKGFIGRRTELQYIFDGLWQRPRGHSQVIDIVGQAGVGKSALIEYFLHAGIERDQWTILRFRGMPEAARSEPFSPLFSAIALRPELIQSEMDFLRKIAPCWMVQFGELSDANTQDSLRLMTYRAGLGRMLREGLALLEHWASMRPVLLVVDDAHWLDKATFEFLVELSLTETRHPIALLMARRAMPAEHVSENAARLNFSRIRTHRHLELSGLSLDEAHALAAHLAPQANIRRESIARLVKLSDGLPLLLKLAISDEFDHFDPSAERLRVRDRRGSASALDAYIGRRLLPVGTEARILTDIACCVAVPVSIPLFSHVSGVPETTCVQACLQLVAQGIFREELTIDYSVDSKPSRSFAISHDLFRQSLRRRLDHAGYIGLIRRILNALFDLGIADTGDWNTHIAMLQSTAGMHAEASTTLRKSCARALARFDLDSAVAALHDALAQLETAPQPEGHLELRLEILHDLSRLLSTHYGSMDPRTCAVRSQIIGLGQADNTPRSRFLVAYAQGTDRMFAGRADQAAAQIRLLREAAATLGNPDQAVAHIWTGLHAQAHGDLANAIHHSEVALNLLPSSANNYITDLWITALSHHCWTAAMSGRLLRFEKVADQLESSTKSSKNPYLASVSQYWIADALRQLGCWSAARAKYRLLGQLCADHGSKIFSEEATVGMDVARPPRERDAERLRAITLPQCPRIRSWSDYIGPLAWAQTLIATGDGAGASEILDRLSNVAKRWPLHASEYLRMKGDLRLLSGSTDEARDLWREALRADVGMGYLPGVLRWIVRASENHGLSQPSDLDMIRSSGVLVELLSMNLTETRIFELATLQSLAKRLLAN